MAALLERIRVQKAEKVMALLQDAIRSQIRMDGEHKQRKSPHSSPKRSHEQAVDGVDDWIRRAPPTYNGQAISSYPKTREFWSSADFTKMSTRQLQAVADLLGVDLDGKKVALMARLQDWVNEPAILAHRRRIEKENRTREKVEASGGVFGFGNNFSGQLGLGHRDACAVPTEIMGLKGRKVTRVFTGFDADYAFALASTGEVYSWGGNGVGPTAFTPKQAKPDVNVIPLQHPPPPPLPSHRDTTFLYPSVVRHLRVEGVEMFACARVQGHVAAITTTGRCYTWGKNDYGELGAGHATNTNENPQPRPVEALAQAMVVAVGVGNSHTVAVTNAGKVYSWGAAWGGQLGLGVTKREGVFAERKLQMCFPSPTLLEIPVRVAHVSCGAAHSGLIAATGQLFMFGCGDGGRLGMGSNADMLSPTLVRALDNERVLQVCCSNWHTLCIAAPRQVASHGAGNATSASGWAYAFGSGLNGQLGLGKQKQALLPTKIPELIKRKMKCIDVKASSYHSCALAEDGSVFTWGRNSSGCLGRFTSETDSYEPDVVAKVKAWGYGPVTSVACGCRFTLLVAAPWKGISKPAFTHMTDLNSRQKLAEGAPTEYVIDA
ncbi:hypothetical protein, variant [Aphanomyces astaci]|uniref:SAP domain-containing protein n=1 Tax=Aphanomyces astaci TaxID=112090 RepID=W4H651_APHAT|nr:hypothetical protein, variant [Aphanomyces astaci]ETV86578.1 hypothetical protein, variant [Aphanomyces astaci]|eukprot:XP_009823377.1 hypothetical protein, variant [Aphanomyces astaci]